MVNKVKKKQVSNTTKDPVIRSLLRLMIKLVSLILVVIFIFTFIFGLYRVNNESMVPNINPGDMIIYYRLDKKFIVGDSVVYKFKGENKLARIVALGGDTVDIDEDGFKVNDARQYESKVYKETLPFKEGVKFPIKLKEGQAFLLADNRDKAADSRLFGPLETKKILGKIFTLVRRRDI